MAKHLKGYQQLIASATGCDEPQTLARIEETMRQDVFHSTLDWQDRETLARGAREAYGLVRLTARPASLLVLPEDVMTARLLGIDPADVVGLAAELTGGAA